jgi:hypothetical protein
VKAGNNNGTAFNRMVLLVRVANNIYGQVPEIKRPPNLRERLKDWWEEYQMAFKNRDLERAFMEWNNKPCLLSTRICLLVGFVFAVYRALIDPEM